MCATRFARLRVPPLAAALLLAAAWPAHGQEPSARRTPADSLAVWYALGLGAHHLCAGVWVVGRDHERTPDEVVAQDIARFPAFRWQDDFRYGIEAATRRATVSAPGIGSRTAKFSDDQGCAILPPNATDVFFQPADVVAEEQRAADVAWPTGDRGAHARLAPADSAALAGILDWAFDDAGLQRPQNTRGIVVIHDGRIVAERYAPGWGPYTPQLSWSMGKSIAATLIGVLAHDGILDIDEPAPLEEWRGERDPRRDIRIRDLLRMSSGLDFDNFGLDPRTSYSAANEHFRIYFDALDVAAHSIDQPARYAPGEVWRYRNSDPLTLMEIARRAVAARGEDFISFPQRRLFDRIGARSFVLETDAWGNFVITGFDFGGTRDWARLGLLYLNDGVWQGERVLADGFTEFVRTPAPGDPASGYGGLFWLNRGGAMDRLPEDAYWMAGYMGQTTMIIPSRDLVVVRHGPSPGGDARYFEELVARVLDVLDPTAPPPEESRHR
jgi:CubicO group peptidase (beta-lactamase class C family)